MLTRRRFSTAAFATVAGASTIGWHASALSSDNKLGGLAETFAKIEADSGGRLGVGVLDSGTGATAGYREDELFPMCSTFKLLCAAAILARVDTSKEQLARRIPVTSADLLDYAPVTKQHAGSDMTVAELCEAAVTLSDNTAANLLLASMGGPSAITEYARAIGDGITRLDRTEPELNTAEAGDPRDTTTPKAMARNLHTLTIGTALSPASREQLNNWLVGCKTGDAGRPAQGLAYRRQDGLRLSRHAQRRCSGLADQPRTGDDHGVSDANDDRRGQAQRDICGDRQDRSGDHWGVTYSW